MKKKELRSKLMKYKTNNKAIKELKNITRYMNKYELYVRCFSSAEDNIYDTSLYIDIFNIDNEEYESIVLSSICIEENNNDYWEFVELSCDILKTMKKNLIKDIEKIGYKVDNVEDYSC